MCNKYVSTQVLAHLDALQGEKNVTIFISNSEKNENVFQLKMEEKYFKGRMRVCHSLSSYIYYVFYSQLN